MSTPTCSAHERRMVDGGWERAESRSMDDLYKVRDRRGGRGREGLSAVLMTVFL